MDFLLSDALLVLAPEEGIVPGWLLVRDGVVSAIGTGETPPPEGVAEIACGGDFIAPGLIDIHCHGACGRDAMEATDSAFSEILAHHASMGTTTAVLTTVAATLGERIAVLHAAERHSPSLGEARLAGIHLEGPWFSPIRRGAHREELLGVPSGDELDALLEKASVIRRVTLAPELAGAAEAVRMLVGKGIAVSAGHSDATRGEAAAGFRTGITQATHLYNAMSSLRKGREGLAEEALATPGILCELIADGVHLPAELLRHAWLAKGWGGVVLVSDATAGAGLKDGASFLLGGIPCRVKEGAAWTEAPDRSLAGSTACLFTGIRSMTESVGVPLAEAVAMATLVPARSLGLEETIGSLAAGKRADLIRFSSDWTLRNVWIGGKEIASRKEP